MPKKPKEKLQDRPIVYDGITVNGLKINPDKLRIDAVKAKKILGWITEDEFKEQQTKAHPGSVPAQYSFGDYFLLTDIAGRKVRCTNNETYGTDKSGNVVLLQTNRPFDEKHCKKLAQEILRQCWRFNGEAMIVSKRGLCISLQHRLCALILATQMWDGENADYWRTFWPEQPYIESIIVFGVNDDPDTLMTLDNTKPRSTEDVFYTSNLFNTLSPVERKECSKMLGAALRLVWRRSQAEETPHGKIYLTHAVEREFVDHHPHLLKAVHHIATENSNEKGRVLSMHKLSAGECAGMLYLMATSATKDPDVHRNAEAPDESQLDLSQWEKACEFWTELVKGEKEAQIVRKAIAGLTDVNGGEDGRKTEKLAILATAWLHFVEGHELSISDLALEYADTDDGKCLLSNPSVGGIDFGEKPTKVAPAITPDDVATVRRRWTRRRIVSATVKRWPKKRKPSARKKRPKPKQLGKRAD